MAFSKKTWTDRVSEQPQRRLITPVGGGTATTVDVTRQEGIVIQEGDAFSAANMNDLENRIKTNFDRDEATINTVNNRSTTNANNISTLQGNVNTLSTNLTGVTTRVGTLENELTANGTRIYMDYKNGKYGYNTSANRGADTFHPFNSDLSFTTIYRGEMGAQTTYTFTQAYKYVIAVVSDDINDTVLEFTGVGTEIEYVRQSSAGYHMAFLIYKDVAVGDKIKWQYFLWLYGANWS